MNKFKVTFTFFDGTTTERIFYGTEQAAREYADSEGDPGRLRGAGRKMRPIVIQATVTPCQPDGARQKIFSP